MSIRSQVTAIIRAASLARRPPPLVASQQARRILTRNLSHNALKPSSPADKSAPPAAPPPLPSSQPVEEEYSPHENYVKPMQYAASVFRRVILYSSSITAAIALVTLLGFEGAHLYVENFGIPPVPQSGSAVDANLIADDGDQIWGWGIEGESWTGGDRGGTDPTLGFRARHLLRSAWMAQHWGAGEINAVSAPSPSADSAARTTDGGYRLIEAFLAETLRLAATNPEISFPPSSSPSCTALDLLMRHASILERIGSRDSLSQAKQEYELVWSTLSRDPARHLEAARLAAKIGDLTERTRDGGNAVDWWKRSIEYATLSSNQALEGQQPLPEMIIPTMLPPSPAAQRALMSSLVLLSAHFSMSHQLQKARDLQEASLRLISASSTHHVAPNMDPTASSNTLHADGNAPGTLHALYLQHRSALLSIHYAEVLYAMAKQTKTPSSSLWGKSQGVGDISSASQIQLHLAATTSERVAQSLAQNPTGPSSLSPAYADNPLLNHPASNLLRDACRSAAEAWNLSGLLYTIGGRKEEAATALECFEKALYWASGGKHPAASGSETGVPPLAEIPEKEWSAYWKNYVKALDKVKGKEASGES